tara:strand:- start:1172 stop:2242 length:1071 start_codon:yes stop_codon:yes gene_type:complete
MKNICLLGTGFGSIAYLPGIADLKNARINTLYGRDVKKMLYLKKKFNIKNLYYSLDELLKTCDDDLFCLTLPPKQQYHVLKKLIKYKKKAILCEKPVTSTLKEILEIKKLLKKNKIKFYVNFQMRYQILRKKIKKIIDSDKIGKILHVNLNYDFSARLYKEIGYNWWSEKKGGGVLNAMGSHQIDLLIWYFGKVKKVFGTKNTYLKHRKYKGRNKKVSSDDLVKFIAFFDDFPINVSISSISIGWKTSQMQIYGSKGALFLNGENELKYIKKTDLKNQEKSKEINFSEKDKLFKKKWIDESIWRASFFRQIKNIVDHLNDNEIKYYGANISDAIKVRKVIDKIDLSINQKKLINVN